jgi:4-diphosphocytidyl-2-C-methyl-D-erythritol kinase
MRTLLGLPAPAKINLFLQVTGRRADGLHCVQSVMQLVDLHDLIDLQARDDGIIERVDAGDTPADLPADDLCVRAARLLQPHAAPGAGCTIKLTKRIPSGAGLGGGSSDAATVLMGLNRLWGLRLDAAQLMSLGLQLGADVPFFIFGRTAWAEGIGEQLGAFDVEPASWLLVKPPRGVATAQVYRHVMLRRDAPPLSRHELQRAGGLRALLAATRNDLQPVAELIEPGIALAQAIAASRAERDAAGRPMARMSGSGSCVFARSDLPVPALLPGWFGARVRALAAHPLHERLQAPPA